MVQGDPLSPLLFNLGLEVLLRYLAASPESGYRFTGKNLHTSHEVTLTHIAVADDITCLSDTEEGLRELTRRIITFCQWTRMPLRPHKCTILAQVYEKGKRDLDFAFNPPISLAGQPLSLQTSTSRVTLVHRLVQPALPPVSTHGPSPARSSWNASIASASCPYSHGQSYKPSAVA